MAKQKKLSIFTNPIFKENPVLVSLLGMCPFLAAPTQTLNNALGMGVAVILVLLCTNTFISLIRKWVPNEVRIPVFICIIACFVTMVDYLMQAFTPDLYEGLKQFIPLITVNCIILGRAEAFASKNSPIDSMLDGIGTGIGFMLSCIVLAFFREVFATGGITLKNPFTNEVIFSFLPLEAFKMEIFASPAGSFLIFGIILGTYYFFIQTKAEKKKELEKKLAAEKKAKEAAEKAAAAAAAKGGN